VNTCFVVEFYEERTSIAPIARVMVLEDADDAASVADRLKLFFNHLKSSHPQFHDAGLMCVRFIEWQTSRFQSDGIGPEGRRVFLLAELAADPDYVVAEVYANNYRPEVRFKRTETITQWELLDAAEVLQQANI
jgi:hypothetical protein